MTGGASGIGYAMAERFLAEGMSVMLADVEEAALKDALVTLEEVAFDVDGVLCDVRKWEDVAALRDATLDCFGKVHVVCNNAGVGSGSQGWMWEYDLNDWIWAMA